MPKTTAMPRPIGAIVLALLLALAAAVLIFPAASVAAPEGGGERLTISPSSAGFPMTTVGTQSPTQQFDVANDGGENVEVGSVKLEAGDASEFNLSSDCGTLNPGQHCTLSITFAPSSVGEKQATVAIHFNDGQPDQPLELSGTSVPPKLAFDPSSYDFGLQRVNYGTEAWLQLANTGEAAVQVTNVDILGGSNAFGANTNDCWNRWLQPNETCWLQLYFNPHDIVSYAAQIRASYNGYSFTADLSGAGGRAIVEASPNPADFGSATAGAVGSTQTITVANSGDLPAGFFIAVIAGGDSGSFQLLDENCTSAPVMPSASCTVHVRFTPQGAGPKSARLALFGDDDGGAMVMLSGEGVAAAATLTPSVFDFGRQAIRGKSSGRYFTVSNDGDAPLGLRGTTIVGADLDQFTLAGDTCSGSVLKAGDDCLLRVRFTPDSAGAKAATLRIESDAGPLSASLTGTAIARRAATPRASSHHPRRLRPRFRHGASLSVARCHAPRCRVSVSPRLSVKGG